MGLCKATIAVIVIVIIIIIYSRRGYRKIGCYLRCRDLTTLHIDVIGFIYQYRT